MSVTDLLGGSLSNQIAKYLNRADIVVIGDINNPCILEVQLWQEHKV